MSGQVVTLFSRRRFDFSDLSGSAPNNTTTVLLVKAVDVSQYTEAAILVRVHSVDITSTATLVITAHVTSPCAEDPGTDYFVSSAQGTVTLNSSTTAASLVKASVTANFGGMLRFVITATQASSPVDIEAELSAELVLKN